MAKKDPKKKKFAGTTPKTKASKKKVGASKKKPSLPVPTGTQLAQLNIGRGVYTAAARLLSEANQDPTRAGEMLLQVHQAFFSSGNDEQQE